MLNKLASEAFRIGGAILFGILILGVPTFDLLEGRDLPEIKTKDGIADMANVDFKTDIRIFTVMAALNAAGFDFETEEREISPVRAKIMEKISSLPPSTYTELRLQYQATNLWAPETTHAAYTSLALLLEGPPEFNYREQLINAPHGIEVIRGFETLLPDFYNNAGIEQLWREFQPLYQEELQRYRPIVNRVITETLDYFRIPAKIYLDRNIVIIPDLLAYQDIVNARNVEDVYYIVVGPTDDPEKNFIKLQHEYLHFLIDPLIREERETLRKSEAFLEVARKQPLFPEELWNDYPLLVTECLIESILHRNHPGEEGEEKKPGRRTLDLIQRGMILSPYFERRLAFYESKTTSDVALPQFLRTMLSEIPKEEIKKDFEKAKLIQKELEKAEKEMEEQAKIQQAQRQRRQLLDQAGSLIARSRFDEATTALDQLLEMSPEDGHAYFYLAQISAKKGDWKKARQLHLRTIESEGLEPWIYAHSLVQIGRINAAEGLYQEARENFEQVMEMEGDFDDARKEAEFLLGKLPQ